VSALIIEAWWPLSLLLAGIPLVVWVARRSETALATRHRQWLTGLRMAALVGVVFAMMRPAWLASSDAISVVYALDVSRSVEPGFIDAAIGWIDRADAQGHPADSQVLAFAAEPRLAANAAAVRSLPVRGEHGGSATALDRNATDLEAALDAAGRRFPPERVKRLVLMSDGVATTGEPWRAVERLRRAGVRVFTVPAPVRSGRDVWVEGIDVPADLRRDEPAIVGVRVQAQSKTSARLVLTRNGKALAQKSVALQAGANVVAFTVKLPDAGNSVLAATVSAEGDDVHDNDRFSQSIVVGGRPRVLFVEGAPGPSAPLRDALVREGIEVESKAPAALPSDAAGYGRYDAAILSDVAAKEVDPARMRALANWVKDDGGGLIFAAGANAYGDTGWRESAVEKILPVTFEAQEKRREIALIIVLDRSYSMKGRKLDLAKAATLGALDLLDENHRFGVITFDSQPEMTVPFGPVRSKRRAEDQISRFTASGQTNIYPALQAAYRVLVDVPSKAKHVILLSDGDTQPADFQRLVKRMAEANITVTTVAIGAEADVNLMESISRWGRGRYYYAVNADRVPKIFIDETSRLVNESLVEEPVRAVPRRKAGMLRGIDFEHAPALKGYVSTKLKEGAELTLSTETGAPLLVRWQYGLGKTAVFTSDVKNRWAAPWLGWAGFGKLFTQLVRETMRRDAGEELDFVVQREGRDALVRLRMLDAGGHFRNELRPEVKVSLPSGGTTLLTLRQIGPGSYEGRWPIDQGGGVPWRFALAQRGGVSKALAAQAGTRELSRPYPDEFRQRPTDHALLRAIAGQTGGKYAPEIREVFAGYGDRAARPIALWPWFAALALVAYLLDLASRRVPRLNASARAG